MKKSSSMFREIDSRAVRKERFSGFVGMVSLVTRFSSEMIEPFWPVDSLKIDG